jgi:hypothetical protein
VRNHAADIEFGPRFSPSWFGDAADTEARRVRSLRIVYLLADDGLANIATGSPLI